MITDLCAQVGTANDHHIAPPAMIPKLVPNPDLSITRTQGGSSDASVAYLGDFSEVAVGIRTEFGFDILADTTAVSKMEWVLRAYIRADVQILRAAALYTQYGIVAA